MNTFILNLNRIFSISINVALNILFRLVIVAIICCVDENYKQCGSHILVILGLLNLTYFFSVGSSIRIKACLFEKEKDLLLLGVFFASLTLSLFIGMLTSIFAHFAIQPVLTLFHQPENVITYTVYFFKCFSFCLMLNALFQSFQQICIGFNLAHVVNVVNAVLIFLTSFYLSFMIKYSDLINYWGIKFAYPFIFYGLSGSLILFLVLRKKFSFFQMKNLTLSHYLSEVKTLFKLSFPFCIQNIHGNLVYFSHILVLGMLAPCLLVTYHIFMQFNLILFIIVLGGVQAFGLDSLYPILKREKGELIKKTGDFFKTIIFILSVVGIIYFIKIFDHIESQNYATEIRYDLWISYGIAFASIAVFLIRNGLIASLTNLGDSVFPAIISTFMSLGVGLPSSLGLTYLISYPFAGIHLGIITHYIITAVILSFRFKNKWRLNLEK